MLEASTDQHSGGEEGWGKGVMPMDVAKILSQLTTGELAGWGVVALLLLLSLIQISPLKINPWDSILGWLGRKLNGKELKILQGEVAELRKQVNGMWVSAHRQAILTFARELRGGIEHSTDEWSNVLSLIDEYEVYCEKNHIANGVVKQDSIFINGMYQDLSREQKI